MTPLLPPHAGLLPYWLLVVGLLAFNNTIQSYRNHKFTLNTYEGANSASKINAFGGRLYGTWTFLSFVVRAYAAYHIDVHEVYVIALWTFFVALGHFGMEWLVYGTMKPGKGLWPVLVTAAGTPIWMLLQYDFYVR